jgi:signal transduction histidine kinase
MFTKETGIFITLITGLIILTILLLLFVVSIMRQQRKSIKDYKLHVLRDIGLIEEERRRIAADLHDDLGSILAAIRLKAENMYDVDPTNSFLKKTIEHLDLSLGRIKQVAHNLMPSILKVKGLGAGIEELVLDIKTGSKIKVAFTNTCNEEDFLPQNTILVFRIVQEITTNILKHAKATKIEILYSNNKRFLLLRIGDNGIGFDPVLLKKNEKSFGLKNIQSRLELLEATYYIESYPNKGTTYRIKIPLSSLKHQYEIAYPN